MEKKIFNLSVNVFKFSLSSKFTLILALEIIISILVSLIFLFIFLKLGDDVLEKGVFSFDTGIMHYFYQLRNTQLTQVMLIITSLASPAFLFSGSVVIILYLYVKRKKDAFIFSAILYSGVIINIVLKDMFHRPRPDFFPLIHEDLYSFPSGHAMNSFVFYVALSYFIWRETKNTKFAFIAFFLSALLILAIGISRIYLGVHYPSDVIAGYIAGFIWFITAIIFEKTIIFERLYRKVNKYGRR